MTDSGAPQATRVGYCLLDAGGAVLAAESADERFYAASTIKLAVLVAVARAVDSGCLDWDDRLPMRRSFGASGFMVRPEDRDLRLPPDGTPLAVRELATAMITWSSNEATNLLVERIGLAAVAEVLSDAGAAGCRMERLIGDVSAAGRTNEVTPAGLARLMLAVVTGRLASAASSGIMIELLRGQEFPVIGEVLAPGVEWGSKSGWVDGIEHDVAFARAAPAGAFAVLAVCTSGFAGRDGQGEIQRVVASVMPRELLA